MPSKILDSFLINPASSSEIEEEIDKLNPSKAVGPYSIPIYVLKLIKETISKPLQSIFNFSLIHGIVPDYFKLACVIPIFKEGSQINLNNYRPISVIIYI